MVQVLLVDDEVHAVRGLQAGVNWDKLEVGAVLTAHSMKQAQDIFASHQVDIMISDIEMPQGTGMELAGWVRENYPRTETIFLTCHSDFSYAKRAIQLDSFEYLLKPVDYGELEEVIVRAAAKIKKDEQMSIFEQIYDHYRKLWEVHQPLMKERFWTDLIERNIPSRPETIKEQLQKYNMLELENARFIPVFFRIEKWHKPLTQRDEKIMEYALRNAAEEKIAGNHKHVAVVPLKNSRLLVLIPYTPELKLPEIEAGCKDYIEAVNEYLFCDLCCYIGDPVYIQETVAMVDKLSVLDRDNVTVMNEPILLRNGRKEEKDAALPSMSDWAELMKQGARDKLLAEVRQYFATLKQAKGCVGATFVHSFYQGLLQMLFYVLQTKGLQANQVFAANSLTDKQESVLRSLPALEEWVLYVIDIALNQIHSTNGEISIVDRVKQYVSENISNPDLSREDIAGYVFLNPDYLTRIFKKETGISISDFLQQQRICYAKELLTNTSLSVSDVAVSAGYSNLSYFSTIFKKYVLQNPNEFRKQVQSKI